MHAEMQKFVAEFKEDYHKIIQVNVLLVLIRQKLLEINKSKQLIANQSRVDEVCSSLKKFQDKSSNAENPLHRFATSKDLLLDSNMILDLLANPEKTMDYVFNPVSQNTSASSSSG